MHRFVPLAAVVMVTAGLFACRSESSSAARGSAASTSVAAPAAPAVAAASAVAAPEPQGGAEWPRFLGPAGNGTSPEKGINKDWNANDPTKPLWRIPLTDDGYAGPSIAGGLVYIVDHKGSQDIVRAINLQTGKDAWTYPYDDPSSKNYGFARATPTVAGGKVWTLGWTGQLNCLDAKSGSRIWSKDIIKEFGGQLPGWNLAGSPVVDGQKLIVCPGGSDASVVALDKDTGAVIWKGGGSDKPGYATPVVATIGGRKQYVVFQATGVVGVDANAGNVIWRHPWKTSYDVNAATPVVIGDSVFVTSGYGTGCALLDIKGSEATERWRNKSMVSRISTPVLLNGHLYGIGEPDTLSCVNVQTGQAVWQQKGFGWGGVVLVDGVLLALAGSTGDLVMIEPRPEGYKELGRFTPLGGQSWTAPVVARGRVVVRNKQELACYSLK